MNNTINVTPEHLYQSAMLCFCRFTVSFCPTLPESSEMIGFLQALGVSWPTVPGSWSNGEREEKIQEALANCPYRERGVERSRRTSGGGQRKTEKEVEEEEENKEALRVNLKRVFQEEGLLGYDPSLGTCTGDISRLPLNYDTLNQIKNCRLI